MSMSRLILVLLVLGALGSTFVLGPPASEAAAVSVAVEGAVTEPAAVCCSDAVCVGWSGSTCSGELGWCEAAFSEDDTGITVAACEVSP